MVPRNSQNAIAALKMVELGEGQVGCTRSLCTSTILDSCARFVADVAAASATITHWSCLGS